MYFEHFFSIAYILPFGLFLDMTRSKLIPNLDRFFEEFQGRVLSLCINKNRYVGDRATISLTIDKEIDEIPNLQL